jgi:mono/diheme cytochrome c family protein
MKKALFIILFSLVGIAVCLIAAQPGLEKFNQFDRDGDGILTREEVPYPAVFNRLDLDQDDRVTRAEALKSLATPLRNAPAENEAPGLPLDKVFAYLDRNKDSQLDPEELTDPAHRKRLDTNQDGFVTLAEARAIIGETVPRRVLGANFTLPETSAPSTEDVASLKEQPQLLKGTAHGIGRLIPALALKDLEGKPVTLGGQTTVIALFSATCPISGKLGPELARLQKECADQSVTFLLANVFPSEEAEEVRAFLAKHQLTAPVIADQDKALQHALAATTTTEAFLLDAARTLLYRGAINDQYGLGYAKEKPTRTYLRDALTAYSAGRPIKYTATTAPGCALDLKPQPAVATTVTYHNQIARILQTNCVECHRQNGLAPFPLETLKDLTDHAGMVRKQVERGAMPPWFAAESAPGHESPWANDRSLSPQDKADLLAWLASSDRPAGNPQEAPLPRAFTDEWSIGKPDYIVQLPRPVSIQAEGTMPYQFIIAETTLTEDKWVQGYEILPTDRSVVHHVIVNVHEKGKGKIRDRDEGTSGYWAAYVPGNSSKVYPPGFARKLPAGARVSFQIHYTPNGSATTDQLRMGLVFAAEPPRYAVNTLQLSQHRLDIPPQAADHVETTSKKLPIDVTVMSYVAHMHVRGKAFKYEVTHPDGKNEVLLDIPRYDFNWQLRYDLKTPLTIPRGSTVKITAVFDNSPANPANPDPDKRVRWGQQTFDEMMIGYFETFTAL